MPRKSKEELKTNSLLKLAEKVFKRAASAPNKITAMAETKSKKSNSKATLATKEANSKTSKVTKKVAKTAKVPKSVSEVAVDKSVSLATKKAESKASSNSAKKSKDTSVSLVAKQSKSTTSTQVTAKSKVANKDMSANKESAKTSTNSKAKTASKTASTVASASKTTKKQISSNSTVKTKSTNSQISDNTASKANAKTTSKSAKVATTSTTAKRKTTKKKATKTTKSAKVASADKKRVFTSSVEYYDLPYRYNETVVKILAQTPTMLFIYWDISDEDRQSFIDAYGEDFFNKTKPVLIVTNKTMNYKFEVEINDFANSWYLHLNDADCDYSVELGRRPIEFINNSNMDNYVYITTSNDMEMPNNHILFDKLGKTVFFKNVKNDFVEEKQISSISFIRNLGKIYSVYELYKEMYKDEIQAELNSENINLHLSSSNSSTFK